MEAFRSYCKLCVLHSKQLSLGVLLAVFAIFSTLGLLSISGWFIGVASVSLLINFFMPSMCVRLLAIARIFCRYFEKLLNHDVTFKLLKQLRLHIYKNLEPLAPAELPCFRSADLLHRLVSDVDVLNQLYIKLIIPLICCVIVFVLIFIGLFFVSYKLSVVWLILVSLLLIGMPCLFFKFSKKASDLVSQALVDYRVRCHDLLSANIELRIFNSTQNAFFYVRDAEKKLLNAQKKMAKIIGANHVAYSLVAGVTLTMLLLFMDKTQSLMISEQLSTSMVYIGGIFFLIGIFELFQPIQHGFLSLRQVTNSIERLSEIERQNSKIVYPENISILKIQDNYEQMIKPFSISIDNLNFCYDDQMSFIFKDITLQFNKGETTAIIGASGSGKSTLLHLLLRDYKAYSGVIAFNGQDISYIREELFRSIVTILPQKVHIFAGTLRDNLDITRQGLSDNQLIEMLERVQLISLLEHSDSKASGLNQWLGVGGRVLSGGEAHRLGLARIMLTKASIILLDEPTEFLDDLTEQVILEQLSVFLKGKTTVMATHRKQPLVLAHSTYKLELGRLSKIASLN